MHLIQLQMLIIYCFSYFNLSFKITSYIHSTLCIYFFTFAFQFLFKLFKSTRNLFFIVNLNIKQKIFLIGKYKLKLYPYKKRPQKGASLFYLSFQSASELGKHRSCCYGSSDNSCYVRAHCLHQQIVGRVVLQAYYLGYTCCHRYGRYAGGSDERVDLVA